MEPGQARYAVVDVETSGLRPKRHRVLQVGVVVVDGNGAVLQRWSSLVRPTRRWFYRVGPTHIHGIHRRDVRDAPPAGEVLRRLADSLDGARFVAHNAGFDAAFLRRTAARHRVELTSTTRCAPCGCHAGWTPSGSCRTASATSRRATGSP